VLCGGKSTRMGTSKALLPFGSETMLQRVVRLLGTIVSPIVAVAARDQVLPALPPDLIVTDVMMPVMDGYELARRVRANAQTRFIPMIIQTAARDAAEDLRRGAEAFAKPLHVSAPDFFRCVRQVAFEGEGILGGRSLLFIDHWSMSFKTAFSLSMRSGQNAR